MATLNKQLLIKWNLLNLAFSDLKEILEASKSALDLDGENLISAIKIFKAMFPKAQPLENKYDSVFDEAMTLFCSSDDPGSEAFPSKADLAQRKQFKAVYTRILEAHQQLVKLDESAPASPLDKPDNFTCNASILDKSLARSRIPKISLPHFNGNIETWPKFKLLFDSMVHSNPEIPTIEKCHYLHSSLSGDPLSLITPLTLNEENFEKAWSAICKRYDDKRLLADSYLNKFLNFAPLKGNPTLDALQSFISNIGETVAGFKSIGLEDESDFIWLSLALRKLDPKTRGQFETYSIGKSWPTFGILIDFVTERSQVLQYSGNSASSSSCNTTPFKKDSRSKVLTTLAPSQKPPVSINKFCKCHQSHSLHQCPSCRARSPVGRRKLLHGKSVCFNCLSGGHYVNQCPSGYSCRICKAKHHTLLHFDQTHPATNAKQRSRSACSNGSEHKVMESEISSPTIIASVTGSDSVVLGTAQAFLKDCNGRLQSVRLLLDCGSQCSLVTADCMKRLGQHWLPSRIRPIGAGEVLLPKIRGKTICKVFSKQDLVLPHEVDALVVNQITGFLPSALLPVPNLRNFENLADPDFNKPGKIDLLIGGDLFLQVITGTPCPVDNHNDALPTVFGLVVIGSPKNVNKLQATPRCSILTAPSSTDELLARFWETEEVAPPSDNFSKDPCEQHFRETHTRDEAGRYVLALPFKEPPTNLEGSKSTALLQYNSLERKMGQNPDLKEMYHDFLSEYQALGHMSEAKVPSKYVIPHHEVFKSNEANPKIRVVFNASCPTINGSLNEKLHVGPKLQSDLTAVILNFRLYKVAVTADLVKMYRQILIRPEDRQFQHILWRPAETEDIKTFELNTVTYGQACAPFQAIRTLHQLVKDDGAPYPQASTALLKECYVDDVVSGGNSVAEAQQLQRELVALLSKGGFQIHKWVSNCPEFNEHLTPSSDHPSPLGFEPKENPVTKILGMFWDPDPDTFFYQVGNIDQPVTKRGILSVIARLFDPMGYLPPVVFQAKAILQELWKAQIDWDQSPPPAIRSEWEEFTNTLKTLNQVRIPRFVLPDQTCRRQLVGFCDASQRGYAAVFYLRTLTSTGEVKMSLLKAKTKLAPLKTLSVPRLELSAAHLLVKLYVSIKSFCEKALISECYLLTDSTIVLAWLKIAPYMLDTFVANRVSFIVTHTDPDRWFHVSSGENPADLSSRGCSPLQIVSNAQWWAGPSFLYDQRWVPPSPPPLSGEAPELRTRRVLLLETPESPILDWISTMSSYTRMLRAHGYVNRAIHNFRFPEDKVVGELSNTEIQESLRSILQAVQRQIFKADYSWTEKRPLSARLKILSAFLDADGLLRVGGRLHNAELPLATQTPILLTGNCHVTRLLISHLHVSHFHMGAQSLSALLSRKFWIFGLRQAIRTQLHRCLPCIKLRARTQNPMMGDLPESRVRPSRPFSHSGVDYAGPFSIKVSSKRNASTRKAYLCLFICLATRAVHLEVVSALSTDALLAALDRFIARRGCPASITSDNGTNFVGANNRLKELVTLTSSPHHQDRVSRYSCLKGIAWHFNPPHAPHFGGFWEAAVKSAKHHLYRVTDGQNFHFEELTTIFARIEAVLNSRPICTSTDEASTGDVLTPGHFLIGAPLVSAPEEDLTDLRLNYLSRWQLVNLCVQHFWARWHSEYLQALQRRVKWHAKPDRSPEPDDVVLVPDPNSLPLQWRLGRILECFPGKDNIVRVVSIKSQQETYKLPVHKVVDLSFLQKCHYP